MRSHVRQVRNQIVAMFAFCFLTCELTIAQDEMGEALKKARELIEFRLGDEPLKPHSVLTTTNPSRGVGSDGTMMLWLDQGRPMVAVSVYNWEGKIMHEIDSLARVVGLLATSPKGKSWKPSTPGVEFRPLTETSLLNETAGNRRLLHMKELAKQFQVTMLGFNDQNSDREQLRMLPTPVYRYSLDEKRTRHTEVVDGAVFAFVQGTDPEALLIIEGIQRDQTVAWEYTIVRATAGALEAKHESVSVFSAEKFPMNTDPSKPHFTFEHTVAEVLGN